MNKLILSVRQWWTERKKRKETERRKQEFERLERELRIEEVGDRLTITHFRDVIYIFEPEETAKDIIDKAIEFRMNIFNPPQTNERLDSTTAPHTHA